MYRCVYILPALPTAEIQVELHSPPNNYFHRNPSTPRAVNHNFLEAIKERTVGDTFNQGIIQEIATFDFWLSKLVSNRL